jgi:ubiquinone/menaquinone biosynthesis C-methylase UbiE
MDVQQIDQMSPSFQQETGLNVLNGFMLDANEAGHCQRLLELMTPKPGAVILDAGCGFGAVAKHMAELRPDLRFHLLNLSDVQLEMCPPGMSRLHGSFDAIPLEDSSVDVVMFNYAICHSHDWLATLKE